SKPSSRIAVRPGQTCWWIGLSPSWRLISSKPASPAGCWDSDGFSFGRTAVRPYNKTLSVRRQTGFDLGDGLSCVRVQDAVNAEFIGRLDNHLTVIHEDHFVRLDSQPFPGQFENGRVGFLQPDLVRVNDQFGHLPEAIALFLAFPRADEAVA